MIKILDCTLRDGGYLNNWRFGENIIKLVIDNLSQGGIDCIECGFLSDIIYDKNISLFRYGKDLEYFIGNNFNKPPKYALMLNYGDMITEFDNNIEVRLSFKKHEISDACNYAQNLMKEGIKVSLNPMHIGLYNAEDFSLLIDYTNNLKPECLTAVDTMGILEKEDVERIFFELDNNVLPNIPLGFHSHNNLNLSMENVKTLIKMGLCRDIIIDTSLSGIGRGGGMLETENLAQYLNTACAADYNIDLIKSASDYIKPFISNKNKEVYSLTAKYKCHPNYGTYLTEKGFKTIDIEPILSNIPNDKKMIYDKEFIETMTK